jgi:uncharacterized protein (DUF1778 family)
LKPTGSAWARAAEAQGKSHTDFMLDAACEKAQQVLFDQTAFQHEQRRFKSLLELINKPVAREAR